MTDKKKFILKLVLFFLFALVLPVAYLVIRFSLFEIKETLSFWGVLIIGLIFATVCVVIKYYLDGMKTKWSYLKQLLNGFIKVIIPLVFVLVASIFLKLKADEIVGKMNVFIEALSVIIASEIVATLINPLGKWAFDNNVDGLVQIVDKIIKKEDK